jgi:hypothetical protein
MPRHDTNEPEPLSDSERVYRMHHQTVEIWEDYMARIVEGLTKVDLLLEKGAVREARDGIQGIIAIAMGKMRKD